MIRIGGWLVAATLGVVISHAVPLLEAPLIFAAVVAAVAGPMAWGGDRRAGERDRVTRLLRGLIAILATTIVYAWSMAPLGLLPIARDTIAVRALAEHNPMSRGSEVWVLSINGRSADRPSRVEGPWFARDGFSIISSTEPGVARWDVPSRAPVTLRLLRHAWSGIAEIDARGSVQRLDLYGETPTNIDVAIPAVASWSNTFLAMVERFAVSAFLAFVLIGLAEAFARAGPGSASPVRGWEPYVFFLIPAAVWGIHLLAFWPAIMSPDSLDQWQQALTGQYRDVHPFPVAVLIRLSRLICDTPATFVSIQVLGLSAAVAWSATVARRSGSPLFVALGLVVLTAIWPLNGVIAVTLWKDVPFAIGFLALVTATWQILRTRGSWLGSRGNVLVMSCAAAMVALSRHNGWPIALGTLAILCIVVPRASIRGALCAAGATLAVVLIVRGPVAWALDVPPPWVHGWVMAPLHVISAHLASGTPMPVADLTLMKGMQRKEVPFNCPWGDVYMNSLDRDLLAAHELDVVPIAVRATIARPAVTARTLLGCVGRIAWGLDLPAEGTYYVELEKVDAGTYEAIRANGYGLSTQPIIPWLNAQIGRISLELVRGGARPYLLVPALFLYIALGSAILRAYRDKDARFLALAGPPLLAAVGLLFFGTDTDYRFMWMVVVSGPFTACFALACRHIPPERPLSRTSMRWATGRQRTGST